VPSHESPTPPQDPDVNEPRYAHGYAPPGILVSSVEHVVAHGDVSVTSSTETIQYATESGGAFASRRTVVGFRSPVTHDDDDDAGPSSRDSDPVLSSTSDFVPLPAKTVSGLTQLPQRAPQARHTPSPLRHGSGSKGDASRAATGVNAASQVTQKDRLAAVVIQAAWRGYYARCTDIRCATVRREMRTRRAERHVELLSADVVLLRDRLAADDHLRELQQQAISMMWAQIRDFRTAYTRDQQYREHKAATTIQSHWRA
jgi:hypothetical protein